MGIFNKAIIIIPLCLLLDMRMIIANSVLHTSLAICHRAVTKSRGLGMFPSYYEYAGAPATFIGNKRKTEPKELPFCTIPLLLIAYSPQLEILLTVLHHLISNAHSWNTIVKYML